MKTISAEQLREQCPHILNSVAEEEITITSGGRAIARLVPVGGAGVATGRDLPGRLKCDLRISGNIMSTGVKWDAAS